MGTLTMALAASLLAGSGPAKVSGEMREPLNFSVEWDVDLYENGRVSRGKTGMAECAGIKGFCVTWRREDNTESGRYLWGGVLVDEGNGCLRVGERLGIYQQVGDSLRVCIGNVAQVRPTSFPSGKEELLLVLHRVKLRK